MKVWLLWSCRKCTYIIKVTFSNISHVVYHMILTRKLGLQLHEGKCHMSFLTIYMLNSPFEVSFPAAEIFLVTPMHSNLEEMPCNMTFQSIHCVFVVTLLFISTQPFTPKSNLSLKQWKKLNKLLTDQI